MKFTVFGFAFAALAFGLRAVMHPETQFGWMAVAAAAIFAMLVVGLVIRGWRS